ncbi:MAG TPA: DUF998 domain-containing protein [Streptosporangiaceae bacterium]|jgi:hypothetical protein
MTQAGSPPRAASRASTRAGGLAAIVAAVSYSSFLLSPWTHPSGAASRGFISELEAPGQPYAWLYRSSDVLAGAGILVAAWAVGQLIRGRHWSAPAVALLALTGVSSIVDAATSMRCDPAASARCAHSEHTAAGLIGQLTALHTDSGLLLSSAGIGPTERARTLLTSGWLLIIGLFLLRQHAREPSCDDPGREASQHAKRSPARTRPV